MAFRVEKVCSNNQVEYETLVLGLEILLQMGIRNVEIFGDSQLVINQVKGQYKCGTVLLAPHLVSAQQLLQEFQECTLHHILEKKTMRPIKWPKQHQVIDHSRLKRLKSRQ